MERIFGIIPAPSTAFVFLLAIGAVIVLLLGFLVFIGYSSKNVSFEVNDEGLRISKAVYGRFIPREQIDTEGVMVINLNIDTEYKPRIRMNGIGLPGYAEGWFKLQNSEKALLFVTDKSRVVYIPTTENYSVLISVIETEEFADLIKQWE